MPIRDAPSSRPARSSHPASERHRSLSATSHPCSSSRTPSNFRLSVPPLKSSVLFQCLPGGGTAPVRPDLSRVEPDRLAEIDDSSP